MQLIKSISFLIYLCAFVSSISAQCVTGDCVDGFGVYKYKAGHKYEGEWKDKKRQGYGTFTFNEGQRQFGQWEEGQLVDGTTYFSNGTQYTGKYLNSAKHGNGTLIYPTGSIQQGQFHNDTLVLGTLKSPHGSFYHGDTRGGIPDGFGTMYHEGKDPQTGWWTAQPGGESFFVGAEDPSVIEPSEEYILSTGDATDSLSQKGMVDDLYENTYVVIVALEDYPGSQNDLRYTRDDAELFYKFLSTPQGGSIPSANIKYIFDSDATSDRIIAEMDRMYSKAGAKDRIIFYFSGHGVPNKFCSYDADFLSHSRVKAAFSRSKAQYKLCFADACYAGSIRAFNDKGAKTGESLGAYKNDVLSTVTRTQAVEMSKALGDRRSNIAVMMSSKADETSIESGYMGHGLFTYHLVRALSGEANLNNDNIIDITEAFIFMRKNVLRDSDNSQSPILFGKFSKYMPVSQLD